VAKLAAVGILEQLQNIGAGQRAGAHPVEVDARSGQPLTPAEVAQRVAAAKP
jgi:hypothetical protein